MEISLLVKMLGTAAILYCGAIFLLSAGMFFIDRAPVRKASVQPQQPRMDREIDGDHGDQEERRAA